MDIDLSKIITIAIAGIMSGILYYLRDLRREFTAKTFIDTQNKNYEKAWQILRDCYDAVLVLLQEEIADKDLKEHEINDFFIERMIGGLKDVYMQNGINPKDWKLSLMIKAETYRRFKTTRLKKEVI